MKQTKEKNKIIIFYITKVAMKGQIQPRALPTWKTLYSWYKNNMLWFLYWLRDSISRCKLVPNEDMCCVRKQECSRKSKLSIIKNYSLSVPGRERERSSYIRQMSALEISANQLKVDLKKNWQIRDERTTIRQNEIRGKEIHAKHFITRK